MTESISIPICLSGGITSAGPSLCLDEATHIINTPIVGGVRVLGTNDDARKALEEFADKKVIVTICGYPQRSPNCTHVEAYHVGLGADVGPILEKIGS